MKALALEKLYEGKRQSDKTLCEAILAAAEACDPKSQAQNVYGIALAKFQLGYLLKTYYQKQETDNLNFKLLEKI